MKTTVLFFIAYISTIGLVLGQDGTFDLSFGNNGIVYTSVTVEEDYVLDAAQSQEGKIAVAGISFSPSTSTSSQFIVVYLEDGTIDTSFAANGFLIDQTSEEFNAIDFQSNGKIIFSYTTNTIGRLLANGDLDTSFGDNGYLPNGSGRFLFRDENDAIYTRTAQNNTITLKRFLPDGQLDTSYGTNGSLDVVLNSAGNIETTKVNILPNGTFFISYKEANNQSYLAKYTANGTPDVSFGLNGIAEIPIEPQYDECSPSIFNDGSLLLSCEYYDPSQGQGTLFKKSLKLNAQGDWVTSFGTNGYLNGYSIVLIQENQRFIASLGSPDFEGGIYINYDRFFSNGSLDTSFQFQTSPEELGWHSINTLITNSGHVLVAANTMSYNGPQDIILLQYNNNPLGVTENNKIPVAVYPNPSKGIFTLKTPNEFHSNYQISDNNGRVLHSGSLSGPENLLDLSYFSSGLYFLKVSGTTIKLLKH